jgi:hypothetical protein
LIQVVWECGFFYTITGYPSVFQDNDPLGVGRYFLGVGDNDNGATLLVEGVKDIHDHSFIGLVKVTGWLVGQ